MSTNFPITDAEIQRLQNNTNDGGWAEVKANPEAAELREKLLKAEAELEAAKAGMSAVRSEDKARHLFDKVAKKLKASENWDEDELVALELMNIQAREAAKEMHAASKTASGYKTLDIQPLQELLKVDDSPLEWRIQGWMQIGHNATLAARYKVGKTTFVTNLLKSLVDGTPFLDIYPVRRVTKPIVVFNHELSERQFTMWLRKAGIENTHMIIPVNLRGKGLYLQDEEAQEWAISLLRSYEAEFWIIDPLQAALRGSVNDDNVASDWIGAADRVKAEAGVSELLLVTHTGHLGKADEYGRSGNERSAGSARWSGWPDALWSYTKDDEGIRYISAEGRDILIEESGLAFDEATMTLSSMGQGTGRMDAKLNAPFKKLLKAFPTVDAVVPRTELATATRLNNGKLTDVIRECQTLGYVEKTDAPKVEGKGRGRVSDHYQLTSEGRFMYGYMN